MEEKLKSKNLQVKDMIKIHLCMQLQVQDYWADSMILGKNKIEVVLKILNQDMNLIVLISNKTNSKWETKVKDNKVGKKN